jgi:tetratricopeptide (TPR) repeat protein
MPYSSRHNWLIALAAVSVLLACNRSKADLARESGALDGADAGQPAEATNKGKIPLTTGSAEARKLYDEGLVRFDQLRFHDAREKFLQAASKDPDFAMAHYQLALSSPSNKEALAHVKQAVAASGKASEGEQLAIRSLEAGFNADPAKSLEYAKEAVARYPEDERARQNLAFGYQGQQDYESAVSELKKAIEINPSFSTAYNSLGYAYRPLNRNAEAEEAFKKYIELVPDDPNPYDSYAELLMKMGRFDESIVQYRKALSIDPHFTNSHFGIASDLMYQGKHNQALAEADKIKSAGRNDADRRLAIFTRAVIYADQGNTAAALRELENQYAFDSKLGDPGQMGQDAQSMGILLVETGKPDQAAKRFQQALDVQVNSNLSSESKEDAKLAHHYDLGRVALAKNDLSGAKSHADQYMQGAEAKQNDFRIRQGHELYGTIALKEKNYREASKHLEQASQQDPYVVYNLALAYQGQGDEAKAKETFAQAAGANILPTLNYALIRGKAKQQAARQSTQ